MDEVEPTEEDLSNPYVLQLLMTICRMDDRIEELEYLCERYIAWFQTEPRIGGTDELE